MKTHVFFHDYLYVCTVGFPRKQWGTPGLTIYFQKGKMRPGVFQNLIPEGSEQNPVIKQNTISAATYMNSHTKLNQGYKISSDQVQLPTQSDTKSEKKTQL